MQACVAVCDARRMCGDGKAMHSGFLAMEARKQRGSRKAGGLRVVGKSEGGKWARRALRGKETGKTGAVCKV